MAETPRDPSQFKNSIRSFQDHYSYLLRSDYNTFEDSFFQMMEFFESDVFFQEITKLLNETDVPFNEWWNENRKWGNGHRKFELPRDELKKYAFLYQLCLKIYNKEFNWLSVQLDYFGSMNVNENIRSFNTHIMKPLS